MSESMLGLLMRNGRARVVDAVNPGAGWVRLEWGPNMAEGQTLEECAERLIEMALRHFQARHIEDHA